MGSLSLRGTARRVPYSLRETSPLNSRRVGSVCQSPLHDALLTHVNQANQWLGPREANTARPH